MNSPFLKALLDPDKYYKAKADGLTSMWFDLPYEQMFVECLDKYHASSSKGDPHAVFDWIAYVNVKDDGERARFLLFVDNVMTAAETDDYVIATKLLKERYLSKLLTQDLKGVVSQIADGDYNKAASMLQELSAELAATTSDNKEADLRDTWIHEEAKKIIKGIPMGYATLDSATGGLRPGELAVIISGASEGKCFGKDTEIVIHGGGIKKVQDIVTGDTLVGENGSKRIVLETHSGISPLFKITPITGEPFIVNGEHILLYKHHTHTSPRSYHEHAIAVKDFMKFTPKYRSRCYLFRSGFDFKNEAIPLDPYILGTWLGDGTTREASITTADDAVLSAWKVFAKDQGCWLHEYRKEGNKAATYTLVLNKRTKPHPTRILFKNIGLLGNKHIPDLYKYATEAIRLQLLAGLIDTDGNKCHGNYEYFTKLEVLAKDVAFLARSLGFSVTRKLYKKSCDTKNGKFYGWYWKLLISGDVWRIPVRLERKHILPKKEKFNCLFSGFTVEPIGSGEYYGFEIDGDHRFCLADGTVVHNSSLMQNIGYNVYMQQKNVMLFSIEMPLVNMIKRMQSHITKISNKKIKTGDLTPEEVQLLDDTIKGLSEAPNYFKIIDCPGATISFIESKIRSQIVKPDLVVVDYLTIIQGFKQSKALWESINLVTIALRELARKYGVPILTAAQVNRDGNGKKSDFYEKGDIAMAYSINYHADIVISLKLADPDALSISPICILNGKFLKDRDGERPTFVLRTDFSTYTMEEPTVATNQFNSLG